MIEAPCAACLGNFSSGLDDLVVRFALVEVGQCVLWKFQ